MDILIISNIMVAVGTLALAVYAHKNIKSSNEQLKFLNKQTKIFTSHQEPYLFIQEKKFKGNKIELSLSNHGEGIAHHIAVNTILAPVEVKITEESERLLRETPHENWDKLDIQGRFNPVPRKSLLLENEENIGSTSHKKSTILGKSTTVYPSSAVTFLFNSENGQSIIKPGDRDKLSLMNLNHISMLQVTKTKMSLNQVLFHFDELKDFLIKNDTQYIGIMFELVCSDKIGKIYHFQEIDSCVVDLKKNKTLEEAIESGRKVPSSLGRIEYQKKIGWQPYSVYKGLKEIEDED